MNTPQNQPTPEEEAQVIAFYRQLSDTTRRGAFMLLEKAATGIISESDTTPAQPAPAVEPPDEQVTADERVKRYIKRIDRQELSRTMALQPATMIAAWLINSGYLENDMDTLKDYEHFGDLVSCIAEILPTIPTLIIQE